MTNPADIVFVTGASRSGTTMLSRILGNHPVVLTLNELHFFGDLCDPASAAEPGDPGELERLAAAMLAREKRGIWGAGPGAAELARARSICAGLDATQCSPFDLFAAVADDLARQAGKRMICEQTPRNAFYARRLLDGMPRARIVHIVRDPRAVLASQKNRWQLRRLGAKNVPVAELIRNWLNYHPITMAKLWADATRAALALADHPRMHIVAFEELVDRPAEVVEGICAFLDIGFEPDMLLVPRWGSSNVEHDMQEKGISREVADRWQAVLTSGEARIAEHFAGGLMHRFAFPARAAQRAGTPLSLARYVASYPFHLLGVALANPRRAWIQITAVMQSRRQV